MNIWIFNMITSYVFLERYNHFSEPAGDWLVHLLGGKETEINFPLDLSQHLLAELDKPFKVVDR